MPRAARLKDFAGPALAVAVLGTGLLVATEIAFRWLSPEPPPLRFVELEEGLAGTERAIFTKLIEPDPDTFWRMTPGITLPEDGEHFFGLISNGQGFREDHEIPKRRPPDELRILFLGASGTWGYRLRYTETEPEMVEALLAQRFPEVHVECINAAVPGYGLYQGWQLLRRDGLDYQPDLVVANFGWNDSVAQYSISDIEMSERMRAARPPVLPGSRLATALWSAFHHPPPLDGEAKRARLSPQEYAQVLARMSEESLARDVDFLTFVSAAGVNIVPGRPADLRTDYQRAMYAFGESRRLRDGVTPALFDGVPLLQQLAAGRYPVEIFFDGYHPRPFANQHTAEALVAQIEPWVEWRLRTRAR